VREVRAGVFEAALQIGTVLLGKYRVEGLLGRGGMGVVIAARHLDLGELFAIKLLDPDTAANPNATSRFLREARASARLTSEHVARVHDVGRLEDGTPYLVMEHLAGDNLSRVLERRGPLPLDEAVELALDACDALSEAHALGIVHRDVKLANLFLTHRRGGRPCLKVIDFGISKQSGAGEQLTTPGAIIGSAHSMAPEQIHDSQGVDGRSDIWSIGVVLYQLTTGEVPFRGDSLPKLVRSVLRDTPTPPSRLRPDLPPAFDEVVARCLRKRPEDRYADVEALAAALRPLAASPGRASASDAALAHRVFISCRCDDAGDLQIATCFYEALSAAGARPFLAPRSVMHRERWIGEVTAALRGCDAFLLLLSPHAAVSEMVATELDMARQLGASHAGRPYILPVRVRFPEGGAEPHPLEDRLQDLEHASWEGPAETAAIVKRLVDRVGCAPGPALAAAESLASTTTLTPTPAPMPLVSRAPVELPGGIVSRRSPFYVVRPSLEDACQREIVGPGALLRIKGPRQMGKTSLMTGITDHAARSGARTVSINLQMADAAMLAHPDRLLRWLCAVVTRRLKLPCDAIEEQWDEVFGAKDNCTAYFEEHLLARGRALVLAIDHLDRVFESPATAEELLALLRAWHEMGKSRAPWDALRMVLAYSTEMYLPLHINHSPFNVGLPVVLGEWDAGTVGDLARRHGLAWRAGEVDRLMGLIGGHPHLVRIALYHVAGGARLDEVLAAGATDEGLFADHLRHLLWHVQSRPALGEAVARVMGSGKAVRLDTEVAFKLVSLGLVALQGNEVRAARELYRRYFTGHLLAA
jgi:serine/threonine-protein kinase